MPIKFAEEPSSVFPKNSGIENFQAKEGGSFTVLSKYFLSHRTEKTSLGTHSVFQKISGRKNILRIRGGEGYHDFLSKSFCMTVPKCFIGEHFGVLEKFFSRKFSCIGGGASRFLSEFFVSQDQNEKLCKGTLLFPKTFPVTKKIYG